MTLVSCSSVLRLSRDHEKHKWTWICQLDLIPRLKRRVFIQEVHDVAARTRPTNPYRQRLQELMVVCWGGNLEVRR